MSELHEFEQWQAEFDALSPVDQFDYMVAYCKRLDPGAHNVPTPEEVDCMRVTHSFELT